MGAIRLFLTFSVHLASWGFVGLFVWALVFR